ncbi:ABC transporter permease [Coriobacteriia bacterium Es71-Z0120]|uniref:ABC transporter permease n=1 Tax=Parvivirga hydrogeniphila TaxID=2939460 RepID=UPI002260EBEB|nr:ABC transporter permease [Parvivirga hydrogeniphila]MCL4078455.1 ABC transporter permease [Parvivirga hydrogeniphila]
MSLFAEAFADGVAALASGSVDVWGVVATSLRVSGAAVAFAVVVGVPAGLYLGMRRSAARNVLLVLANAGMGLPPVVVGLVTAMLLSRRGPLGSLDLLYTRPAMVIAQVIIAVPVVAAVTAAAAASVPFELRLQARSLGASRLHEAMLVLREARMGLIAAVAAGFGAVISEVGAVMMVGGNLEGSTRVMTTAIVQYTRMGRYGPALALSAVLLALIVAVNVVLAQVQRSAERFERS